MMAIRQALEEGYRGSADHGSGLLLFLVVIIVMAGVAGLSLHLVLAAGATDWGGPLLKDTVLRASDNPHIVNSTVEVPAGITLTIEPGVELYFGPGASLIVRGRLLAEGTLTQTILFTRRDEGTYWGTIAVIE